MRPPIYGRWIKIIFYNYDIPVELKDGDVAVPQG